MGPTYDEMGTEPEKHREWLAAGLNRTDPWKLQVSFRPSVAFRDQYAKGHYQGAVVI